MIRFFLGVVEITLSMSAVILLLFLLLRLAGGRFTAKCRYILWVLVFVRLCIPCGALFFPALWEVEVLPEGMETTHVQAVTSLPGESDSAYMTAPAEPPVSSVSPDTLPAALPEAEKSGALSADSEPAASRPVPETETETESTRIGGPAAWKPDAALLLRILSWAYAGGAAAYLLWHLLSSRIQTAHILRGSRSPDAQTMRIFERVCEVRNLRRRPSLYVSSAVHGPMAFGVIRTKIVLPDMPLDENMLAATLMHELTHCRRGDLFVKFLLLLGRSLHCFNPLVHFAAARCETEMELSCDESVLGGCGSETRHAYGQVMLELLRRGGSGGGTLTTHFNPRGNAARARLRNILYGSGKRKGWGIIALCAVLCLLAGAVVACRVGEKKPQESVTSLSDVSGEIPADAQKIPLRFTPVPYDDFSGIGKTEPLAAADIAGGVADDYPEAAELRVGDKTVWICRMTDGSVCAAYTDGEYRIGSPEAAPLFRFQTLKSGEDAEFSTLQLIPFTDILGVSGFFVTSGWTHLVTVYYCFDETGALRVLDACGAPAEAADIDGDGVRELVSQSSGSVQITDRTDTGELCRVELLSLVREESLGNWVEYRAQQNDFLISGEENNGQERSYRIGRIQGDALYVWENESGYTLLRDDGEGGALLFVRTGESTLSTASGFCLSANGWEKEFTTSAPAWIGGSRQPRVSAQDVSAPHGYDAAPDAVAIFTTLTEAGERTEEMFVLDGADGSLYAVPAPYEILEASAVTEEDGQWIVTSSGERIRVSGNADFRRFYTFEIENGVIYAAVRLGAGELTHAGGSFRIRYVYKDAGFAAESVSYLPGADVGRVFTDEMTVPLQIYGSDTETIGEVEVTLLCNEILCGGEYGHFTETAGLEQVTAVRCDTGVTEEEIFNWCYSGFAREYNVHEYRNYTREDGWYCSGKRYYHGMNDREIAAYGREKDAEYRARREYMYLLRIADCTYLMLDFRVPHDAPALENEGVYYDRAVGRTQTTIRLDTESFGAYILDSLTEMLRTESTFSVQTEKGVLYPTDAQPYLDAMQAETWIPEPPDSEYTADSGSFMLSVNRLLLCASDEEHMILIAPGSTDEGIMTVFRTPSGTAERLRETAAQQLKEAAEERQNALDQMNAYLPPEATELLLSHRIFSSSDYLLAYRTEPRSVCLYRAENQGERYVRVDVPLPKERVYDSAEIAGITGGGGSGEYTLYIALYRDGVPEYVTYVGVFRDAPYLCETEIDAVSLMAVCGKNAVFPNRTTPRAIRDLADWDELGMEKAPEYAGVEEDIRLGYLRAFLSGDTQKLEQLCGVQAGMYDSYRGMHFRDWVIYVKSDGTGSDRLYISFVLTSSTSDAFPYTGQCLTYQVGEGMFGAVITEEGSETYDRWFSDKEAANTLRAILRDVNTAELPMSDEIEDGVRWQLTEYICGALGGGEKHTCEEVAAYAEMYFGIADFTPDPLHVRDGYCTALPHGGSHILYRIVGYEEEDGRATLTVRFFADPSRTVLSDCVEYTMTQTEGGGWALSGYVVSERGKYPPFAWSV